MGDLGDLWDLLEHPWELPWGPLGPREVFYTDFGAFLAPFCEPKWSQKVLKNRDVFHVTFWDHFCMILSAFGSHEGPLGEPFGTLGDVFF